MFIGEPGSSNRSRVSNRSRGFDTIVLIEAGGHMKMRGRYKIKSVDGTKPNTNPKTNLNPNTIPNPNPKLTLFSCFMLFWAPSPDLQSSRRGFLLEEIL